MKDDNWHFDFYKMTQEEKDAAAEKLRNGVPENMLVLRIREDGRMEIVQ